MNRRPALFRLRHAVAVAATAVAAHAHAQDCMPPLTGLQSRLLSEARQGPEAVRRYIDLRRSMLQLDVGQTQAWTRALLDRCADRAAAAAVPTAAASAPAAPLTPIASAVAG